MNPITIISLALAILALLLAASTCWLYLRQQHFLAGLTQGLSKNDLKTILKSIASQINQIKHSSEVNQETISQILTESQTHVQHIGFVRFNPFSDTGGDQSFCLCLLDDRQNGIMITSLHSREQTRMYAKRITQGKSDQQKDLFEEEKHALKQAIS